MTSIRILRRIATALALSLGLAAGVQANTGGMAWDKAPGRVDDLASLQNGAKLFVNYCLNCHQAAFMRYTKLRDLGLKDEQIKANLLLTDSKLGDTMVAAINAKQAKAWFGNTPPDLTVIARSRAGAGGTGADYLYTYLRTFYRDETKATGWNNLAFPNVAMPHVLWELQGQRKAVFEEVSEHGLKTHHFKGWEQLTPGTLTAGEYDKQVGDLVNYLQWMAEPAQTTRTHLGVWVLAFLLGFTVIAWRLNQSYWKDVR